MVIYTVTGDDGSCLFLQIFLRRNISFFKSISRQARFKGTWSPNRSTESKDLWNPSDKKWEPNCMREGKEHAEHCTASSVGAYFDIPIWWKFISQAKHTNINFPCFDLWIQIAVLQFESHIWISKSLNVTTHFLTLSITCIISLLNNIPAKSIHF